jgi:hypothetical protein
MAPERTPKLVIYDSVIDKGGLSGTLYYVEPQDDEELRVRWGVGAQPPGYSAAGGGVAYVSTDEGGIIDIPPSENFSPESLGKLRYRLAEGLRQGLTKSMFILILPQGYTLADPQPRPTGTLNHNGRIALHWILKADDLERTEVEWSICEFKGDIKTQIERINRNYGKGYVPISSRERQVTERIDHIFICYRRSDSTGITERIYDKLVERFGRTAVFKDVHSVPYGADFRKYINDKVGECRVMLVVIGDQWLGAVDKAGQRRLEDKHDFVRIEIEGALQRDILIIPLLLNEVSIPQAEDLPASLRDLTHRNAARVRNDPDFHTDVNRLIKSLEKYLEA